MKDIEPEISADEWDEINFPRPTEQEFDRVVERAISRRGFLGGTLAFGSGAAVMGTAFLKGTTAQAAQTSRFAFDQLAPQTDGTVHVPAGYKWDVLVRWGDPLFSNAPEFDPATGVPTEGSDLVFGENTDGMELFNQSMARELLVVNSEYVNKSHQSARQRAGGHAGLNPLTMLTRLQNFQGVSGHGGRRIRGAVGPWSWTALTTVVFTINTPMVIDGPAAGHDLLKTAADPTGTQSPGHVQQLRIRSYAVGHLSDLRRELQRLLRHDRRAGPGRSATRTASSATASRIWIEPGRYNYHGFDERFDLSRRTPTSRTAAGYIVEIDPADPDSTRSSTPRSAASSTRTRPMRWRPMADALSSTWATTSAASTCTSGFRTTSTSRAATPRRC